ncbi:MAG: nickel pincer cofactor biosynthesis protein LarB [Planctomycetota bacterium]
MTPSEKNNASPAGTPGASGADGEPLADFATLDYDRARRCGYGEVIYAAGKQPDEVVAIARQLLEAGQPAVLATRTSPEQAMAMREALGGAWPISVSARGGAVVLGTPVRQSAVPIPIVTAGTSDLPVAEEAAATCRALGHVPHPIQDVGVAGLHRVLARRDELAAGRCVVVVAGMEGALPSVVGGLVDVPVIAVPTSVGYGASFGGLSALLGMLNSCASGVTVVNIDNGFGAGYAACQINRVAERAAREGTPDDPA